MAVHRFLSYSQMQVDDALETTSFPPSRATGSEVSVNSLTNAPCYGTPYCRKGRTTAVLPGRVRDTVAADMTNSIFFQTPSRWILCRYGGEKE